MKIQFLVLLLVAFSCTNPQSKQEQVVDSTLVMPSKSAVSASNVQQLLKSIMGTGEGLLRGVKIGDAVSDVKKKETLELFEEETSHIGYTFDTESLETVDILYMKDGLSKVNGIQLDIYMNTDASNENLKTVMGNMFTVKYGKPTESGESQIWKIKPNQQVSIKAVKSKIDRGLEVRFSKNGGI